MYSRECSWSRGLEMEADSEGKRGKVKKAGERRERAAA